jgi:hypothetical protein
MATRLLLHFDNSISDSSGNSQVLSNNGVNTFPSGKFSQGIGGFSTTNYPFQNSSTILNGIGLGSFTIELFAKLEINGSEQAILQYAIGNTGSPVDFFANISSGGSLWTYGFNGAVDYFYNISSLLGDGQFHHFAFVRESITTFKIFIDGVMILNQTSLTASHTLNDSLKFVIGQNRFPSNFGDSSFAGVIDELRISDTAIYTANFTPPTTPFAGVVVTTTPVIRAKQTVGDKWIISLLQDPTDGLGVSAPLGSIAQVNASGISSIWLKSGALDSDWVKVNTGVSENGWNVAYSLATLDDVTADAYFGTNGTTFNGKIIFARHGTVMMEFNTSDQVKMSKNTIVDYASGQRVSISDQNIHFIQDSGSYDFFIQIAGNEFQIDATNNLIVMRAMAIHERLDSANSFKNRFYNNHNGSSYEQMAHADNFIVSNVVTNMTFNRVYGDYSNNDIVHGILTVVLRGTVDGNVGSVVFKKDYHVMNKQIIFDQDSFTSQDTNADVADLLISDFSYASQTFTVSLKTKKNGKTMQSTYAKVFIEEKVMNF